MQFIVTHHPVLFRGAKRLTSETPDGRLLLPLLRAGVAVYSPHTAFDNCRDGINDAICRRLGLTNVAPLRRREGRRECKLVVFVPDPDLAKVSDAVFAAGAGVIGQYEQCSYRLAGTSNVWAETTLSPGVIGGTALPGWFSVIPPAQTGTYEYTIEALRAGGSTISKSSSTFIVGSPTSVNEPSGVSVQTNPTVDVGMVAMAAETLRMSLSGG